MAAPTVAAVMIACLFAGVGAWAAEVTVTNGTNTYASELFGSADATIRYPEDKEPVVVLTIPGDAAHMGSAEITFTIDKGAFTSSISGLMWDPDGPEKQGMNGGDVALVLCDESIVDESTQTLDPNDLGCLAEERAAPANVATIVEGGRAGGNSIKIRVGEAVAEGDTPLTAEEIAALGTRSVEAEHTIWFTLPRLTSLTGLAHAAPMKSVKLSASVSVVSGAFTSGAIGPSGPVYMANGEPHAPARPRSSNVVLSRDSLTHSISAGTPKAIAITGDDAFTSVKGANAGGYVALATVTINTKQVETEPAAAVPGGITSYIKNSAGTPDNRGPYINTDTDPEISHAEAVATEADNLDEAIYTVGKSASGASYYTIYDLDGKSVDAGLRGTFSVMAKGTRELFNDRDMLFVDYDGNGEMGSGEEIDIDGDMGESDGLSIDPDRPTASFGDTGKGTFTVYYMAGGKDQIEHGATIELTALVDYSDPSAIDEAKKTSITTFGLDGVTSEVMAYAIPFDGNSKMDKANVRVRCETSAGCRVFLECWDNMGMRSFGGDATPLMIAGNSLMRWNAAGIEKVVGITDATSRHSCRVLSTGMVSVQQLTRDGSSGTLVNNTYVGK